MLLHHGGPTEWPAFRGWQTDPVSLWSWPVQWTWGQPGECLQSPRSERPDARLTWQCRSLSAGATWVSRAMWRNVDWLHLLMKFITGGKLVQVDTSALVTSWDHCVCKICHWHFMWNASNFFSSHKNNVQVSAACNKMDITIEGSSILRCMCLCDVHYSLLHVYVILA